MGYTLHLKREIVSSLDLRGILPETLSGLSIDEVARSEVWEGNRKRALVDLFDIQANDQPDALTLIGQLGRADHIGADMSTGSLTVEGDAGHHLGQELSGGKIVVQGSVGNQVGQSMRGGELIVTGNVGHDAGCPLPGNKRGMRGGQLLVGGSAGDRLGQRQRRGLIAVLGDAGDFCGYQMLAGTILIAGKVGQYVGLSSRRGTIILGKNHADEIGVGFRYGCRYCPPMMVPLLNSLKKSLPSGNEIFAGVDLFDIYHGDQAELGRAEIFLPVS